MQDIALLDEKARTILERAEAIAVGFGHPLCTSSHILLALLDPATSPLADLLLGAGVDVELVRLMTVAKGAEMDGLCWDPVHPPLPLSPAARRALEFATQAAVPHPVSQADLLVGLAQDSEGLGGRLLNASGIGPDEARQLVQPIS